MTSCTQLYFLTHAAKLPLAPARGVHPCLCTSVAVHTWDNEGVCKVNYVYISRVLFILKKSLLQASTDMMHSQCLCPCLCACVHGGGGHIHAHSLLIHLNWAEANVLGGSYYMCRSDGETIPFRVTQLYEDKLAESAEFRTGALSRPTSDFILGRTDTPWILYNPDVNFGNDIFHFERVDEPNTLPLSKSNKISFCWRPVFKMFSLCTCKLASERLTDLLLLPLGTELLWARCLYNFFWADSQGQAICKQFE